MYEILWLMKMFKLERCVILGIVWDSYQGYLSLKINQLCVLQPSIVITTDPPNLTDKVHVQINLYEYEIQESSEL